MPRLQQGSIVWAQLPVPVGRRPVVVLTRDSAIGRLNAITVAPLTRTIRNIPTEVVVHPSDGVPTISAISLDNILTVPRSILLEQIATLTHQRMLEVLQGVRIAFDMP